VTLTKSYRPYGEVLSSARGWHKQQQPQNRQGIPLVTRSCIYKS
jgi:hypothetical protein